MISNSRFYMTTRTEKDSLGTIEVPSDKYWGAQTQRSITYFSIGNDRMPIELIHAYGIIKKAAATTNHELDALPKNISDLISQAADEIIQGKLDDHFPLSVWMTGSGTQTNMNLNEVIANRSAEIAGSKLGSNDPVHPNDHVNKSQSTNDSFPAAMHVAIAIQAKKHLLPNIKTLRNGLDTKAQQWQDIVKIGRTHMQDATPLTLGQEFSGYVHMLDESIARVQHALEDIYPLALGGTAVGTGINAHPDFADLVAKKIAEITKLPFSSAQNKFAIQGAHDAMVAFSGSLRTLAVSLFKIANDIRLLACGPRCGLGELHLPVNEPGSSIMPGKINPTQCEALAMVAAQVMGNDVAVGMGGASGYLEMNVYKPLIINNILQSIKIMSDSSHNFNTYLVKGMTANTETIEKHLNNSLMLVTALSPVVGYHKAAEIAKFAHEHNLSLKEACLQQKIMSADEFDKIMNIKKMISPNTD